MMIFCRFTYFDPPATVFFSVFLPPYKGSQLYCKSFSVDRENFPNFPKFSLPLLFLTISTWLPLNRRNTVLLEHVHAKSLQFSSVQYSRSVMSNSLRPHESQHARPPCPSTSGVHSDSCSLSRWCHPAISSSVIPFSSCPQSLPASESFPWVNSSHEVAKVLEFQL